MTVELGIIWVCCGLSILIMLCNAWSLRSLWKAHVQRDEMAKAISDESRRRIASGDIISWHHLFAEFDKVRQSQHALALTTFRDPYKLYPPYIRRLVGR